MIFRCGFSRRLGPVSLMDDEEVYLNRHETRAVANISVEMGAIAQQEIKDLLDGAEAKAYYALVSNYEVRAAMRPVCADSVEALCVCVLSVVCAPLPTRRPVVM